MSDKKNYKKLYNKKIPPFSVDGPILLFCKQINIIESNKLHHIKIITGT